MSASSPFSGDLADLLDDLSRFFASPAEGSRADPPVTPNEHGASSPSMLPPEQTTATGASHPAVDHNRPAVTLAQALADADDGPAPTDAASLAFASGVDVYADEQNVDRFVSFSVGGSIFAARIPEIVEVGRVPPITDIPNMPGWMRGIANVRGDIVSVIDLRPFCGLGPTSQHQGRMLVARDDEESVTVGLLVERVHDISGISASAVRQPATPLEGPLAPFVRGLHHRDTSVVALLDVVALLRSPDVRQFDGSDAG